MRMPSRCKRLILNNLKHLFHSSNLLDNVFLYPVGYSDYPIKCQDSDDDGCGSTLIDSYVSIYDTDPLLAANALRIQPTNKIGGFVLNGGDNNGFLMTPQVPNLIDTI